MDTKLSIFITLLCTILLALSSTSEARGVLKVDHVFGSAGDLITINRLTTTGAASITSLNANTINPSGSSVSINAPQIGVQSSLFDLSTTGEIDLISNSVNLNSGAALQLVSNSVVGVTATTTVAINTPEATTNFITNTATFNNNGFTASSGKGGLNIVGNGSPVFFSSPLSAVSVTSGGAADISAVQDVSLYSANGILSLAGDTASFLSNERTTVFGSASIAFNTPSLSVTAADDLAFSAQTISVSSGNVQILSRTQEVTVTGASVIAESTGALTVTSAGEGVTLKSAGTAGTTITSSSGPVSVTSTVGSVVVHSDTTSTFTVTNTGTITAANLNIDGGASVTLQSAGGFTLTGSPISLSSLATTIAATTAFTAQTGTSQKLTASSDVISIASGTSGTISLGSNTVLSVAAVGSQSYATAANTVIQSPIVSLRALGGSFPCGDLTLSGATVSVATPAGSSTFTATGGAVSLFGSTTLNMGALTTTLNTGTDANSALLINAGALSIFSRTGTMTVTSNRGSIDYLLANTASWQTSSLSFNAAPLAPFTVFGYTAVNGASTGTNLFTVTDSMSILSLSDFNINSKQIVIAATGTNNAFNVHGAVSMSSTNSLTVTAPEVRITSAPSFTNLDSVSFVGGFATATSTTGFSFTAFRNDVSFSADQDILLFANTGTASITIQSLNGGFININAANRLTSSATNSLISGLNIRTSSVNNTQLVSSTIFGQVSDRGVNTYSYTGDTSLSGLQVVVSSDEVLRGQFGRDGTISALGANTITSKTSTNVASSAGIVSIGSRANTLTFNTGRNAFFQTAGIADSTVDVTVAQSATFTATGKFSAQVTQDSLRLHGASVLIGSADRFSIAATALASFSGATTSINAGTTTSVLGGSINFSSINNNLFVESPNGNILVRSEIGSLYGFATVIPPAVAGIEDTINMRTKRHLNWNAGGTASLHSASNSTFTVNRQIIDDDDDGDGTMTMTANGGSVTFQTASDHDNDVAINSGGAVSLVAQSSTLPMAWSSALNITGHATRTVSIIGHQAGAFAATANTGYLRLDSNAGAVSISTNGGNFKVASTRSTNLGGSPVFVVASNQLSSNSQSFQVAASGSSPLSLPNAPGRTDGGQLVSDVDSFVGVSIRTTDTSGNIAIDSRNAQLTYASGRTFYATSPNNITLTSDSGFAVQTASTTFISSNDGVTQIQGALGSSFTVTNQLGFEASRLLAFQTEDLLTVSAPAATSTVSFLSQSGNIALRTQFFKDINVSSKVVSLLAGGGGASLTAADKIAISAAGNSLLTGTLGVTLDTIGGKVLLQSQAVTLGSSITAAQNVSIEAGSRFTVRSGDTLSFLGGEAVVSTTGGGISIQAAVSATLGAAHSLILKSGTSTNQKTTADRTLLQAPTLSVSGSQRLVLDPTKYLRIGTTTKPTVTLNAGGTPTDAGMVVQSQGNILTNTDSTFTLSSSSITSLNSGYEGSQFISTLTTTITSTQGNVFVSVPNTQLLISSATTTTVDASSTASVTSGGVLSIASTGTGATSDIELTSTAGTVSIISPLTSLHSNSLQFTTTTAGGSISVSAQSAVAFNAVTKLVLSQTAAASTFSVQSQTYQVYSTDAIPAVGTPALAISTTTNGITVQTAKDNSDISFITQNVLTVKSTAAKITATANGINIDAGKGVNENLGASNIQLTANAALTFATFGISVNASNALFIQPSGAGDITVNSAGRVGFDSESTLSILSAGADIQFQSTNVLSFTSGGDFLINWQKIAISATAGQVTNTVGGLYSVAASTSMKLIATGGATIPNLPNEPNLAVSFRATVDAPNVPLRVTAPTDILLKAATGIFVLSGKEIGNRGSILFSSPTSVTITSAAAVSFAASGNPDLIGGSADNVFKSTATDILFQSTNGAMVISGSGNRPDSGSVVISAASTGVVSLTSTAGAVSLVSSRSDIFEAGTISLSGKGANIVSTGPVSNDAKSAYGISVDVSNLFNIPVTGTFGAYPAGDLNAIGATVSITATALTLNSFATSNNGADTGVDLVSHSNGPLSISATSGITLTASAGTVSLQSQNSVTISGQTVTSLTAQSLYMHSVVGTTITTAGADKITGVGLTLSAAKSIDITTPANVKIQTAPISFTGDYGIFASLPITFNAATPVVTTGVDSVLFRQVAANTMTIDTGANGLVVTAGTLKSTAPSGDLVFAAPSFSSKSTTAQVLTAGDNILGLSTGSQSFQGQSVSMVGWNGGLQFRSIAISGITPTTRFFAQTSMSITAGTWQSFRQHRRLRFFEGCAVGAAGNRVISLASPGPFSQRLGLVSACSCAVGSCPCPYVQSVTAQIYWALSDYGLILDPNQNPQ